METKRTISEHSQNMNKLGGMNKCSSEWENHYEYEDFIFGKLSLWKEKLQQWLEVQCFIRLLIKSVII